MLLLALPPRLPRLLLPPQRILTQLLLLLLPVSLSRRTQRWLRLIETAVTKARPDLCRRCAMLKLHTCTPESCIIEVVGLWLVYGLPLQLLA